ncbi:hypothetical protein ACP4OV_021984 [Aristida adscensionis]
MYSPPSSSFPPSPSSSCPSKLPCSNSTIEIRAPFFVDAPGLDPACRRSINVSCGDFGPELNLITRGKLILKAISYGDRVVVVQDVELSALQPRVQLHASRVQLPEQLLESGELVLFDQLLQRPESSTFPQHVWGRDPAKRGAGSSGSGFVCLSAVPVDTGVY